MPRMSLSAWARVAEVVAALGVIIGLIFLSLDVREDSEWGRYEVQMCDHRGLNIEAWNRIVAPRITEPFRSFLELSCRS